MKQINLVLIIFLLTSCAYSFRGSLPENLKRIHIEAFGNKTNDGRDFSSLFSDLVETDFINDNTLQKSPKPNADLVLTGNIESIRINPASLKNTDNRAIADQFKISVSVSIVCKDIINEKDLVKSTILREAFIDANANEAEITTSIETLLKEISENIVDQVIGAW